MIRGTTPTLEFILPFETDALAEAHVTLAQKEKVILTKKLDSCACDGSKLSVCLTQAETLQLDCGCITEIQVRVRTKSGDALASDIIKVNTHRILEDGEI